MDNICLCAVIRNPDMNLPNTCPVHLLGTPRQQPLSQDEDEPQWSWTWQIWWISIIKLLQRKHLCAPQPFNWNCVNVGGEFFVRFSKTKNLLPWAMNLSNYFGIYVNLLIFLDTYMFRYLHARLKGAHVTIICRISHILMVNLITY